jgi:DNA-binding response OmpR family regulator
MPGMSGTQFVSEIRKFAPNLPVLVISGMDEACEQYLGLNVEFRVKPLPPDNLIDCVRNLLADSPLHESSTVVAPIEAAR